MRVAVVSFVVLINYILQSTLFSYIEILSIRPNTALAVVVCYAILRGDVEGAILGFFTGLLQDIFFGRYIGFYALTYALLGFCCGKPFKDFFPEHYFMPMILTLGAAFANSITFYIFNFLLRAKLDFGYYFFKVILLEAVYTALISAVIYKLIHVINSKLEKREKAKRPLFDKDSGE